MNLVKANYNSYYDVLDLFKKLINKFEDVPYYAYLAYNKRDKFNNFIDINKDMYFIYNDKNKIIGDGSISNMNGNYKLSFNMYQKRNINYDEILNLFLEESKNLNIFDISIDISEKDLLLQSIILSNNGTFTNKSYNIKNENYNFEYRFNLEKEKRLIKKNN